jgi:hypothetical protein
LFDRAKLDLDEAKALILAKPPAERRAAAKTDPQVAKLLSSAATFAERLKTISPAHAALVLGQVTLLKAEPNFETARREALAIFADGLKATQPQNRWLRLDLLRERIALLDRGDTAVLAVECFTLYQLLTETGGPADQRVEYLIRSAAAQQAVYRTKRAAADRQEYLNRLRTAIREFPNHRDVWLWQYSAADELAKGTPQEKQAAIELLDQCLQKAPAEHKAGIEQLKRSINPG